MLLQIGRATNRLVIEFVCSEKQLHSTSRDCVGKTNHAKVHVRLRIQLYVILSEKFIEVWPVHRQPITSPDHEKRAKNGRQRYRHPATAFEHSYLSRCSLSWHWRLRIWCWGWECRGHLSPGSCQQTWPWMLQMPVASKFCVLAVFDLLPETQHPSRPHSSNVLSQVHSDQWPVLEDLPVAWWPWLYLLAHITQLQITEAYISTIIIGTLIFWSIQESTSHCAMDPSHGSHFDSIPPSEQLISVVFTFLDL